MAVFCENLLKENFNQVLKLAGKSFVLPDAVQAGICLKYMQMSVHRLALVGILVAEPHVADFSPFAGECFEIAVLLLVETVLFDVVVEFFCKFKRFCIACSPVEFGKTVDAECDCIDLLLGVERGAVRVDAPVYATELFVKEIVEYQSFGPFCHLPVFLTVEKTICARKGPENTRGHDCPDRCLGIQFLFSADASV